MCASALRQFQIRAVYYGCANDRFGGIGGVLNIQSECAPSSLLFVFVFKLSLTACESPSIEPPYPVFGGIFREEAIMLLRRFYVQENGKGRDFVYCESG